jgi:hypothetical protein
MLTYRALQSNSEAIGCDIAAYLDGVPATFTSASAGSICSVKREGAGKPGVILLPFETGLIDSFQLWRADMEIMHQLRHRAAPYCPSTPQIQVGSRGVVGDIAGASPLGNALGAAQQVFGMLATQADTSPVGGTILDQAFMNAVARQLRILDVSVLMPSAYRPNSLSGLDESKSPFLASLLAFLSTRDCVTAAAKKNPADATLQGIGAEMNAFLTTLNGGTPSGKPSGASSPGGGGAAAEGEAAQVSSSSPLLAILSADGLAQKLGVDPTSGKLPELGDWPHILFVKALESGGSVMKTGNILGTQIRYSGGSVGTYALFATDGELECSGNVFDFGGSVPAKKFREGLREYTPDPGSQIAAMRGSCKAPVKP